MDILLESLTEEWQSLVRLSPRLLMALLVFVVSIFVGRLIGRGVVGLLSRGNFGPTHRSFFKGLTTWVVAIIGLIIGLNVLGLKGLATSLVAGGGITAVVLGFAFREIGENLLAGFFLAFSRPFEIGDLIQSGEFQGIVTSIELRSTHIRTADGRDIYIPSSEIFNKAVTNFTEDGLRRLSFTVGVDYADDTEKARQLLSETTMGVSYVLDDPRPGAIFSGLLAQYVELEVFFWVDTFEEGVNLGAVRNEVIERCRRALMSGRFTVSANVTNNVALGSYQSIAVRVNQEVA
ncbi:MAG: mechanosensitive ion channel [bacterium]